MTDIKELYENFPGLATKYSLEQFEKAVVENEELRTLCDDFLEEKNNWCVLNFDYKQLEVFILGAMSKDPYFLEALNKGLDIHDENTKRLYNIDKTDPSFEEKRRSVKAGTFAVCVAGDTEIELKVNGLSCNCSIESVKSKFERRSGWKLETLTHKGTWEKIDDVIVNDPEELIEIELENGFLLKGTKDHEIFCWDGEQVYLKSLEDIGENDSPVVLDKNIKGSIQSEKIVEALNRFEVSKETVNG